MISANGGSSTAKVLKCLMCGQSESRSTFMEHIAEHLNYRPHQCAECDFRSVTSEQMADHEATTEHVGQLYASPNPYLDRLCYFVYNDCEFGDKNGGLDKVLMRKLVSTADEEQQIIRQALTITTYDKLVQIATKMSRRWICSDVWMDIFPSFDHAQLGLKMALISDRFDVLVDTHFDGKSELTIWRTIEISKDEGMAKLFVVQDFDFEAFPLPDRPLPVKIRFKHLQIEYIDHSVIEFLHSNKHIWDKNGTALRLYVFTGETEEDDQIWAVLARQIWPIISTNIRNFTFKDGDELDNLRRRTSPTILTDLDQLNSIHSYDLFLYAIGDDGPNATAGQALAKWLHTPSKNGQPKELHLDDRLPPSLGWINYFKETFLRATTSVSYNIRISYHMTTTPTQTEPFFEVVNERTNEKLTLVEESECNWLMKRCPIVVGETEATVQRKKDDNWDDNLNNVHFSLWGDVINLIGPLSSQSEEEKKADQSIEMSSDCAEMN